MKTAFPYWRHRIAPVFDTARQFLIVTAEAGMTTGKTEVILADGHPTAKLLRLVELQVDSLVCGALSSQMCQMAAFYGITVVPFIAGDLDAIVRLWVAGKLAGDANAMPGCRRRRGRRSRDASFGNVAPEELKAQNEPQDRLRNARHGRHSACQAAARRRKI